MTITIENLESFILENDQTDWIPLLKRVQDNLSDDGIVTNYLPMFVFYSIKHESDLGDFKDLMAYIYSTQTSAEISNMFYRFFTQDEDASISEYIKMGQYNEGATVWEQMGFTFVSLNDHKYILENTPYLVAMLETLPKEQVSSLYNGTFSNLIDNFIETTGELIPIIEATSGITFQDKFSYSSAHEFIVKQLASWPFAEGVRKDIYNLLDTHIPNFTHICTQNLIKFEHRTFEINMGLCDFIEQIGSEKIIHYLDTFYKTTLERISGTYLDNPSEYVGYISSTINKIFTGKLFTLDIHTINPQLPLLHNFIGIHLLDIKLQNNMVDIPEDVVTYLNKEFNKVENSNLIANHLNHQGKDLGSYLQYLSLNSNLSQKIVAGKKIKI